MASDWKPVYYNLHAFCIKAVSGVGSGDSYNLYVGLEKPSSTFAVSDIPAITEDGLTYTVWSHSDLQAVGLGYILRWRVGSHGTGVYGQWVTPPADWNDLWMQPASTGIPFWKSYYPEPPFYGTIHNVQDWWNIAVPWINSQSRYGGLRMDIYSFFEIRLVSILPHNQISDLLDQIEYNSDHSITTSIGIIHNRPGGVGGAGNVGGTQKYEIKLTPHIRIAPRGTCTTPSAEEATVYFGVVQQTNTWLSASRNFTLTLRDCPRTSLQIYMHANGKWVSSTRNVLGLSDSTPTDNPRKIGIKLYMRDHINNQPVNIRFFPDATTSPDHDYPNFFWNGINTTNTSTGVTHTIPMRADLVRIGSSSDPITPGPFKAVAVFVIRYP